jgi:hypothetical protein
MKTIEGKELIAEFDELSKQDSSPGGGIYLYESPVTGEYVYPEDLEYDSSWDCLISVVEKIESLGYFCMINRWSSIYIESKDGRTSIATVEGKNKLQNTYQAIIKFIQWYNENHSYPSIL